MCPTPLGPRPFPVVDGRVVWGRRQTHSLRECIPTSNHTVTNYMALQVGHIIMDSDIKKAEISCVRRP